MADTEKPTTESLQQDISPDTGDTEETTGSSKRKCARAGLITRPMRTSIHRPTRPSARLRTTACKPVKPQKTYEPITITTHEELAAGYGEVARRFNENHALSSLLLINPVLAFKEVNVLVSTEISRHILHTMQHPPALKQRRETLENSLRESLQEAPQPNNPAWVAELLFTKLKITPLNISGQVPVYKPPINSEGIAAMQALRPQPRQKNQVPVKQQGTFRIRIREWNAAVRRMDLEAPVGELPSADEAPSEITLEDLFFYKDQNPLLRDLLELGIIQRRAFPFHSGDSYRKIKNGEKPNAFRAWIRSVKFSEA